jgi:M6 family metalloprotease-like protein
MVLISRDAVKAMGGKSTFGKISVLYIIPTKGAKDITTTSTYAGPITLADGTRVRVTTFDPYSTSSSLVLNHETGHTMGLPDLYPTNGGPPYQYSGGWDLMGWHYGTSPDYFACQVSLRIENPHSLISYKE